MMVTKSISVTAHFQFTHVNHMTWSAVWIFVSFLRFSSLRNKGRKKNRIKKTKVKCTSTGHSDKLKWEKSPMEKWRNNNRRQFKSIILYQYSIYLCRSILSFASIWSKCHYETTLGYSLAVGEKLCVSTVFMFFFKEKCVCGADWEGHSKRK